MIKSKKLSQLLWNRLLNTFEISDFKNIKPYGFDNDGIWRPHSINPLFRICKYNPGGHFKKHRDGGFVVNDNFRSVMTLIVYLNDNFTDGETQIYDNQKCHFVRPEIGKCIIFNHDLEHKGIAVSKNTKYILRTDIMFQRISRKRQFSKINYLGNPEYIRAEELYQESIKLQKLNQPRKSTQKYLEAMEIQAKLGSTELAKLNKKNKTWIGILPIDMVNNIFSYLLDQPISFFISLLDVHFSWNEIMKNNYIWYNLYRQRWKLPIMKINSLLCDERWYHFTEARLYANKYFQTVSFDLGYHKTSFNILDVRSRVNPKDTHGQIRRKYMFTKVPDNVYKLTYSGYIPSLTAKVKGHYWGAGSGVNQYAVGYQCAENMYSKKFLWDLFDLNYGVLKVIVLWILDNGFSNVKKSESYPILLELR